jgi:ribonuclease D
MQLRYAADDVRYLVLSRQQIGERLEKLGHTRWAEQECAAQCRVEEFRFDPEQQYLRVRGANSLQPRNLAVLRELTIWRDTAAREANVPPRAFLRDEIMIDLARNPVRSTSKLAGIKGLPRPVEAEYGQQIVTATEKALALAETDLPLQREPEQTPPEKFRTDSIWSVAQALCSGQGIDIAVVSSRQDINDFYQYLTANNQSAPPHHLLTGWRKEALGGPLQKLLAGTGGIELRWGKTGLQSKKI